MSVFLDKLTETEILLLEAKWKGNTGSIKPYVTFTKGSALEKLFAFPVNDPVKQDPNKIRCSFCGKDTDRVNITHGIGPLRSIYTDELVCIDGIKTIIEKVRRTSDKITSCPNCISQIKPNLDKDGNMVNSGIRFDETEG